MSYSPPKYPTSIPDQVTDLPDRTDDIDWIEAWIYNYVKKELVAVMTELGTDPAGTEATVAARLTAIEASGVDESVIMNIYLNSFRIAILGSYAVMNMAKGISDEYEDETGIDTGTSENEDYDSDNDLYKPTGGFDEYDKLICHFNIAKATSTEAETGQTITFGGTADCVDTQKKWTKSLLLDGDSDYVTVPDSADWHFADGNFTIDMWIRFTAISDGSRYQFVSQYDNADQWWSFRRDIDNKLKIIFYNTGTLAEFYVTADWKPSADTWYHIAVVRSSANCYIFIGGVSQDVTQGTAWNTLIDYASALQIGYWSSGVPYYFPGYIDELRISKGVARWTSGFTPPTEEYSETRDNMTIVSETFIADETADEARIIIFEEDVDEITLNTDIKAYVSRDNGANYTQITLTDEGDYSGSKRILSGTADISGQAEDTDMVYKITTHNNKDLKLHGGALSWA